MFYLNNGMRRAQELDESGNNSATDDLVDGRVALLGEKLAETGGCSKLIINVLGHDTLNHGGELLVELCTDILMIMKAFGQCCVPLSRAFFKLHHDISLT